VRLLFGFQAASCNEFVWPHEITHDVMVFKSDATYKSTIKMPPGFGWIPSTLTVFPSGDLLAMRISGNRIALLFFHKQTKEGE
jgi:hypothetical protein